MAAPSTMPSNPSTPAFADDVDWITAYLAIHTLSDSSRRYSYLIWVTVGFIFLLFALLHWTGSRGGFVGACWSKWTLRRRTWRKKHSLAVARRKNQPHRQPSSLPSNAQLLCLVFLLLATTALSVAGPDYIAPGIKLWQFYGQSPSGIVARTAAYDSSSVSQPQYTISKAWWTAGGRTGQIAFALLPLCILFVLKAPPFAIFAIPFLIQLFFDKLAWLHRWSGRLIWLMSTTHVALWTVQLLRDRRETTGRMALVYAWQAPRFIYGWIAFGLLTLIIVFSIQPLRKAHYKAFYFLHILLVPLFLVASALHHPPVWWWCWAALALWAGERLWRGTWWLHGNGYFGGMSPHPPANRTDVAPHRQDTKGQTWQMNNPQQFNSHGQLLGSRASSFSNPPQNSYPYHQQEKFKSFLSPPEEQRSLYVPRAPSPLSSISHITSASISSSLRLPQLTNDLYVPPPGYAHAELLAGRTVRLRFISPGFLSWAPGQHFLVSIPSVSRFTSHPFTVASVCDEHGSDAGRVMVLLIRAKNGWTRDLWDAVVKLTANRQTHPHGEHPNSAEMPIRGVLMRMYVDGPFGSSVRARWGTHSTVLLVAGGSGVSFALSVLEYVCMCMSGRDGQQLGGRLGGWDQKGFTTSRIRFVWLVREFSHIQWGATILRRCMAMVPAPSLQIDIFVTNFKPLPPIGYGMGNAISPTPPSSQSILPHNEGKNHLAPPTPGFARRAVHSPDNSIESLDTVDDPIDSYIDLSYYTGEHDKWDYNHKERESGDFHENHEAHILDLTNFDGDIDTALPGEEVLNRTVKKQGKLRRANKRKAIRATLGTKERPHEKLASVESRQTYAQHRLADVQNRDSRSHRHGSTRSIDSTRSTDELLSPPSAGFVHSTPEIDLGSPMAVSSEPSLSTCGPQSPPVSSRHSHSEIHSNSWDSRSDIGSTREMMPRMPMDAADEGVKLDIGNREMNDMNVVSEHARPGKPKLDRIVADEQESSKGSMIVGCCGPTSLNAMVRKIIAEKIDPGRIRWGDMRGMIALVSEEFEY